MSNVFQSNVGLMFFRVMRVYGHVKKCVYNFKLNDEKIYRSHNKWFALK